MFFNTMLSPKQAKKNPKAFVAGRGESDPHAGILLIKFLVLNETFSQKAEHFKHYMVTRACFEKKKLTFKDLLPTGCFKETDSVYLKQQVSGT